MKRIFYILSEDALLQRKYRIILIGPTMILLFVLGCGVFYVTECTDLSHPPYYAESELQHIDGLIDSPRYKASVERRSPWVSVLFFSFRKTISLLFIFGFRMLYVNGKIDEAQMIIGAYFTGILWYLLFYQLFNFARKWRVNHCLT